MKIRFSRLKNMALSPAHYRHSLAAEFDSPALRNGRLVHHAVLGASPSTSRPVEIFDGGARRGKAWDAFLAAHPDADIFLRSEHERAQASADAILGDREAMAAIRAAGERIEQTISWTVSGLECSGTPDAVSPLALVDVKSTMTADPRRWLGRWGELRKRAYHAQLAWYLDGVVAAGCEPPKRVCIVAVETKAPHPVTVFDLEPCELEAGRRLYRAWVEELRVCLDADHWPGYAERPVIVTAPEEDEMPDLIFPAEEIDE